MCRQTHYTCCHHFTSTQHSPDCNFSVLLNTLPSCHVWRFDCYATHCWWVMYFNVRIHNILHVILSYSVSHIMLRLPYLEAKCLGVKLQTHRPFLTANKMMRDTLCISFCHFHLEIMALHRSLFLCFVDRASRYMCVMKQTCCTIYLQFIQSLYLYMFWVC
jgi:hypothetical protein